MRLAINFIHSWNWRTTFFVTLLFLTLYLIVFEKNPKAQSIIPAGRDNSDTTLSIKKGQDSKVKSPYDDRFDSQARLEDPYPILGEEFVSPIDAVPGRRRPLEPERAPTPTPTRKKGPKPKTKTEPVLKSSHKNHIYRPHLPAPKETAPPERAVGDISPEESKWLEENNVAHTTDVTAAFRTYIPEDTPVPNPPPYPPKHDDNIKHVEAFTTDTHYLIKDLNNPKIPTPESQNEEAEAITLEDPNKNTEYMGYIAICSALKDIPLDLPEWLIHHYHHLNISTFYIMDDGSSPPLSSFDLPDNLPGEAVVFEYQNPANRTGNHSQQLRIYERCLQEYGSRHIWMAFIDGDEFLQMTAGNETFLEMLEELEGRGDVGTLAVNWRMHTSSGYLTRPDSVRKAFVDCIWDGDASQNSHVKSIVRTQFAKYPINPHVWQLKDDKVTVGEHGDVVNGSGVKSEAFREPITRERIALHHYAGKSREEYEEKMMRGNAMDDPKGEQFWDSLEHKIPKVACPEMAVYDP